MNTEVGARLNPRIKELDIGTREIRTINIYPLSAGQELQVVEIVTALISTMGDSQSENQLTDFQTFEMFASIIKEKMSEVLVFVTDPNDNVTIDDLDNHQLADFLEIIYEANFGESVKKLNDLWEKAKVLFPSHRSLPNSSGKQATS